MHFYADAFMLMSILSRWPFRKPSEKNSRRLDQASGSRARLTRNSGGDHSMPE